MKPDKNPKPDWLKPEPDFQNRQKPDPSPNPTVQNPNPPDPDYLKPGASLGHTHMVCPKGTPVQNYVLVSHINDVQGSMLYCTFSLQYWNI